MKTFIIAIGIIWLLGSVALPMIELPGSNNASARAVAADSISD